MNIDNILWLVLREDRTLESIGYRRKETIHIILLCIFHPDGKMIIFTLKIFYFIAKDRGV